MFEAYRYCQKLIAIVALSGLTALPAVAIDPDEVLRLCGNYLLNHYGDPKYEKECSSQMALLTTPDHAENMESLRRSVIPIAQALPDELAHDGDRDRIVQILRANETVDVIVEFMAREVRLEANTRALERGLKSLSPNELEFKRSEYAAIKADGLAGLQGVAVLKEYENLPTAFVRVESVAALEALLDRPEVKTVHENRKRKLFLDESLPLINQPAAATAGHGGAGTTIAVIDTGVNFGLTDLGSCTSAGVPAGCRVVATFEAAPNDFSLDDVGHGTHVSLIAAATAGDADLVVADVFELDQQTNEQSASDADIEDAIDWAVTIQDTFNIVAINLSLGDPDTPHVGTCASDTLAAPLAEALAAGIQPIISSGNAGHRFGPFVDGIASPACVPAAVSVGNVYDDLLFNGDPTIWDEGGDFECTDDPADEDGVACSSQTAAILSLLAPGAIITAAGASAGGTSQAAPHVAGAWSVFTEAVPNATEWQLLGTLQMLGEPVVDTRPTVNRTTSRLEFVPEPGQLLLLGSGILGLFGMSSLRKRYS